MHIDGVFLLAYIQMFSHYLEYKVGEKSDSHGVYGLKT